MADTDELLKQLTGGNSEERSQALRALRSQEAPTSWIPADETMTGLVSGAVLGATALPLSKLARKLNAKAMFKDLAKFNKEQPDTYLGIPGSRQEIPTTYPPNVDAWENPAPPTNIEKARKQNLANIGALAGMGLMGGAVGGGVLGSMAAPDPKNYIAAGKMDEDAFKAMVKVLGDKSSSAEDKNIALEALEAQGDRTKIGVSDLGEAAAYGAAGTILGGLAGKQIGKHVGKNSAADSEPGMLTDLLFGEGARKSAKDRQAAVGDTAEGLGDAIGMTAGGIIPFVGEPEAPESYRQAIQQAAEGDKAAARRLSAGYDNTTGAPGIGEDIGVLVGVVGGALGGGGLAARRLAKMRPGASTKSVVSDYLNMVDVPDREVAENALKINLGLGMGGAAGTIAGTYAGANYEDPFQ